MRVLVCGGRDFTDHVSTNRALIQHLYSEENPWHDLVIIHGGARGADTLAGLFGKMFGLSVEVFPADWEKHGLRAGYLRNNRMLSEGKPDLVIAFQGGKGTAMMVKIAREADVKVIEVE